MALTVTIQQERYFSKRRAIFKNEDVEFTLSADPTDYYEAAMACMEGLDWHCDYINVQNGMVTFIIEDSPNDVYMKIKMSASLCSNALMAAFDELSDDLIE